MRSPGSAVLAAWVVALTGHQCIDAVRAVVGRPYGLVPVAPPDKVDDLSERGCEEVSGGLEAIGSPIPGKEPSSGFMQECR